MKTLVICLVVFLGTCFVNSVGIEAKSRNLSKKEKTYYAKVLKKELYNKVEMPLITGGNYILEDLNNDGRKELIITGVVGVRTLSYTILYYYDGKKFHHKSVQGMFVKHSKSKFLINDSDYEGAGEVYYTNYNTYSMSKNGSLKKVLSKQVVQNYVLNTKTTKCYQRYNGKMKKISQKKYNSILKKYKMVKSKERSKSNVKKDFY